MASIPYASKLGMDSRRNPVSTAVVDQTADGAMRVRDFGTARNYDFSLVWPVLSQSEAQEIVGQYWVGPLDSYRLDWPEPYVGEEIVVGKPYYSVVWAAPPVARQIDGGYWTVSGRVVGKMVLE